MHRFYEYFGVAKGKSVGRSNQPFYIRALNRAGAALHNSGVEVPRLEPQGLLASAMRKTGLADFGEPGFREGLDKLTQGLREQAQLSQVGRIVAHYNLVDHLCVRLRLIEYRKRRPDVARQQIKRPLFILGLPRTGTTILFELIAQDPAIRSPASWEVARPLPPPRAETYDTDTRSQQVARLLPVMEKLAPGFRAIHAIDAHLPQECVYLLASHFISEQFAYMYNLPEYRDWALDQDMSEAYRWHASFLQHLQVDMPRERWVLKSPAHLAYLDTLLAQYPDACIVWTHRRPLDAITSFSSLTSTLHGGFSEHVAPLATGAGELGHYGRVASVGMAQRKTLDESQFFDTSFTDICQDPLAVVRQIYSHFGLTLTPEAAARMESYLAARPRYLYGKHHYAAADFGIGQADESRHFQAYLDRFADYL